MPWLRLWTDILDDPDLHELPEATCWGWTLMLASAKKFNREGELPPLKTLAHWMRKPRETVGNWIDQLVTAGLLEGNGVTFKVHGWEKWQTHKDQTNTVRQARFRAQKKSASHAGAHTPAPAGNTRIKTETETETDAETLRNSVSPLRNGCVTPLPDTKSPPAPASGSHPDSPEEIRVCNLAAEIGGDLSWSLWALRRLQLGDSVEILEAALGEAVNAGKLNQSYVAKIAVRLKRDGLPKVQSYGKSKVPDPVVTNQPVGAQNPPPGLEQFTPDSDRLRAIARAKGVIS